ncbi:MAG: aldo/keto reductase [Microbacteriaceae bacterium]|nr:aldo/keto reductase [Microbacteriaceae bacterium]MCL2793794.1 aldo/keto reductase [Microbacteriaceae bacterium]
MPEPLTPAAAGLPAGWIRPLGPTGLSVSALCLGAGPLGGMPELFGYDVTEADAVALVREVLRSGIRFIDTSNGYSKGASEIRIGLAIAAEGGVPDGVLVETKVDADGSDYSGARVRRSVEESMERLGLDHLPVVHLHDPEFHPFDELTASGGAVDALVELKREGAIGHIGVAGGDVREIARYVELGVFELLLTHNRWTLVDRSAGPLIEAAVARGMGVLNAAAHGGGILARPRAGITTYGYRPARPATLDAVAALDALAAEHGADLASVALAWSLRDPRLSATIVGFTKPARIAESLAAASLDLPEAFWARVEELVPAPENWLDGPVG